MFAMPRLRLLGALVIGSALAALLALVAYSPAAQAHHSWGGYHWARTTTSFTLKLGDHVTSQWDSFLKTTSDNWSKSTVLDTMIVPRQATSKRCRPTAGQVEVCNSTYGNNGWLGLAQIWISGGHVTQGTTKLNDTYFNTSTYNTAAWRNLVMCQEVGHTFGLDHQDETFNNPNLGTCMDYTNDPDGGAGGASATDPSNVQPNQGDYDELLCVYDPAYNGVTLSTTTHSCTGTGHLDSTPTVGSASAASPLPPAAKQGTFNSKADWGRKIRDSGKRELWVRDFGGGAKVVTWVIRP
jgi:hypothetical protein